jgi:hypothetical protein
MRSPDARAPVREAHRRAVGPEILSAAADNDPTNVGTAASVGAQTAYQFTHAERLRCRVRGCKKQKGKKPRLAGLS